MSTPTTLQTATQDRKARLAQLKSLQQRKQAPHQDDEQPDSSASRKRKSPSRSPSPNVTKLHLSGRNYDTEARGPKLGYESQPGAAQVTIETQASAIAEESKRQQEEEARQENQAVDLFKLQPKKPTWDLKRHLDKKLEVMNVRTDNAIARIVRERVQKTQQEKAAKASLNGEAQGVGDGEAIGVEGASLVDVTRELEKEDEQPDSDDVDEEDDAG